MKSHNQEKEGESMDKETLLSASQVAEMLGSKWIRQRVHEQVKRGTFPEPTMYTGTDLKKSPLWTVGQIEKYMKEKGIES